MFKKTITFALLFLTLFATMAQAADDKVPTYATAEIPIFAQKIQFQLPLTWKHAFTDQSSTSFMIEFIPINEDINSWTNLFSIQGFKNIGPDVLLESFANKMANNYVKTCPKTVVYSKFGKGEIGGFETFQAILGCTKMPKDYPSNLKKGMSEISFFTFIKGQENIYVTQKSYRSAGFDEGGIPPKVKQAMLDRQNFLPLKLCALSSPKGKCNQ